MTQIRLIAYVLAVALNIPAPAKAWTIPSHMLSAAIAYQVLQQENPQTIDKVKAVLDKHPWYANQWQARLQDVPVTQRRLGLFMQASRWADDIRTQGQAPSRGGGHGTAVQRSLIR